MHWKQPPIIKIYEALGCIADGRITILGNTAAVFSSSRKKAYDVAYSPSENSIMSNDNGTYHQGYLGYPAIALLMTTGELEFSTEYSQALKGIMWKDINTKYGNNFEMTLAFVEKKLRERGVNLEEFHKYIERVQHQIADKKYKPLGERKEPPKEQ